MANVEIVRFAHFYNEGVRGARGGAASNDKVWGIAKVDGKLVNFWGRRNGTLKFKTHYASEAEALMNKWQEKIGARRSGDIYTPVSNEKMISTLCPNLVGDVTHYFYSAMSTGKLNTRH